MKQLVNRSFVAVTALSLMTAGLMLGGCGGSGGGTSKQVVSGTAAVGSPLAGQVTLKDSSSPAKETTVNIDENGCSTDDRNCFASCEKRKWSGDDFIAVADSESAQANH